MNNFATYLWLLVLTVPVVSLALPPRRRASRRRTKPPRRSRSNTLYRMQGRRQLTRFGRRKRIYTGITCNPTTRFRNHHRKPWWKQVRVIVVENYPNRRTLAAAERRAIRREHPFYNIIYNKSRRR